jgi:hypothetical protein
MIRNLRHGLARRKRGLTMATLVLIALALAAGVWAGGGAGFTRVTTSTSISTSGTGASALADAPTTGGITLTATLDISFKDAGLGNPDGTVTITGTVQSVSFSWECFNKGGKNPNAANKGIVEVPGPGPISDTFQIDKNGNVTGTLGPFSASIDGSFCPSGQDTHVFAVFHNIDLRDSLDHTAHLDSVTTDTIIY